MLKIRLRDSNDDGWAFCISCNKPIKYGSSECHAGHYIPAGASSPLRWNEFNVNVQCVGCNTWKNGNPHEYRNGMILKYGEKREREIWNNRHDKNFYPTRFWLENRIEQEKLEIIELQKTKHLK